MPAHGERDARQHRPIALGLQAPTRFHAARRGALVSAMPGRERYLFVCTNRREDGHAKGSCAAAGSEELVKKLKAAVLARGAQARVRVCSTSCLDLCEHGAAVVDEPRHVVYGGVTAADVDELADALVSGEVVSRLVVDSGVPEVG